MEVNQYITALNQPVIAAEETEKSRRYLSLLQRWIPTALAYYSDWELWPETGYFFGGAHYYALETILPAVVCAVTVSSPEYDPGITGISAANLRKICRRALRFLVLTHDTGPEGCVRPSPALGRKENWGTKWGERGRGFFPESQCGRSIAEIVVASLFLRPYLDEETLSRVAIICQDYLQRFGTMSSRSGVYADTQMEENGWTSLGLLASTLMLERHPLFNRWEENARLWMFCTATCPQDLRNKRLLDGRSVASLCGGRFTTLPDFMVENHGFVHPNYASTAITFSAMCAICYRLFGRKQPPELFWHRKEIYDNLKRLSNRFGFPMPVQGMDWPYFITIPAVLHGLAAFLLNDPEAGYLEQKSLTVLEKIFSGQGNRLLRKEVAENYSSIQDPLIVNEPYFANLTFCYLASRLYDSGVKQSSSLEKHYCGVKIFPHSGFVFHRHSCGQNSFSWRNHIMALPWNKDGPYTIGPAIGTLLGSIRVRDYPESQENKLLHINRKKDGFSVLMVNDLAQGSVRQMVLFASLPDGSILSLENLIASQDIMVDYVHQGYLEIVNETYPFLPSLGKGYRIVYHPAGRYKFFGTLEKTEEKDTWTWFPQAGWLNVDDKIGLVFSGSGKAVYHHRHFFKPFHAVSDELFLNYQESPGFFRKGKTISSLVLRFFPRQKHLKTARGKINLQQQGQTVAIFSGSYLLCGNFSEKTKVFCFSFPAGERIPVFPGFTLAGKENFTVKTILSGQEGFYYQPAGWLKNCPGISADLTGNNLYLTNNTPRTVILPGKLLERGFCCRIQPRETVQVALRGR